MGSGFGLSCKECNYSKELQYGVGFMYGDLNNVISYIPKRLQGEIKELVNKYNIATENKIIEETYMFNQDLPYLKFEEKVFKCISCNNLFNKIWVKIYYGKDKVYKTKYKCYKCKKELEELKLDERDNKDLFKGLQKLACPKCGFKYLEINAAGNWD